MTRISVTFLDRIRQTITRYAMLSPGDHLGVAVSGGADSLCLLYALLELQAEFSLHLSVIHVDHNLRGSESQADADFVHKSAQQLSLPFHLRTLDLDPSRGNLEQEARRARHQFFRDLIRDGVVQKVALGHTRSDQAETVLFRVLRGAGSAGLAGIRPVTNSGIIRPLLQVTRLQVEGWLKERGISWREDATNAELRFDRNRIRHQLIPSLETEWNPGLSEILAQMADWAFEEERYWQQEIPRLTADWVRFAKSDAILDVNRLNALPVAAARRLIREVVGRVKDDLLGVSFAHIEAIRRLSSRPEGAGRVQIAGIDVRRSFNWLRFARRTDDRLLSSVELNPELGYCRTDDRFLSSVELNPELGLCGTDDPPLSSVDVQPDLASRGTDDRPLSSAGVHLELVRNKGVYNSDGNALDWDKVEEALGERTDRHLVLRNWRPGDQYQRRGQPQAEKLKKLFQENRIPLWERQDWPVITIGDSIAWASQFGPAAQFAVDAASRTVLQIRIGPRIRKEPEDFE